MITIFLVKNNTVCSCWSKIVISALALWHHSEGLLKSGHSFFAGLLLHILVPSPP